MSDQTRQVYRPTWVYRVMNVVPSLAIVLISVIILPEPMKTSLTIVGAAFVLMLIGQSTLTRLVVSPQGLDYRYWPYQHIRCRWEDIERLAQKRRLGYTQDIL